MIDRQALVRRHNPRLTQADPFSPLSVGNGELAFTADFTGLQTFLPTQSGTVPLCTMSQWGFHSFPTLVGQTCDRQALRLQPFSTGERLVGYMTDATGQEEIFNALRINPHRLNLARIVLAFQGNLAESSEVLPAIAGINQLLDLWTGMLDSRFTVNGLAVRVLTACHPHQDTLAVRIESPLLASGFLSVAVVFPYGSPEMAASDWNSPSRHTSTLVPQGQGRVDIQRELDETTYHAQLCVSPRYAKEANIVRTEAHRFDIRTSQNSLEVSFHFSPLEPEAEPCSYESTASASAAYWQEFWSTGGALELANSPHPAALELERRIVLSRYLTAIQCTGSLPPQETGLTCNSWYGKFHLEMHFWHAAHLALWGKADLLQRSLPWYHQVLPVAAQRARDQGYAGVRWPKMTDPTGLDSPSPIGPLLCWQQPHPILFCELLYRSTPTTRILTDYAEIVFQSAAFMASYARWDGATQRYVLGPPLIPAQENHAPTDTLNPTYELEYWRYGLRIALEWKRRLRQPLPRRWLQVLSHLADSPLDNPNHRYSAHERCTDTYGRYAQDHPSFLCAYGVLPGTALSRQAMSASLDAVLASWRFETAWGWDFPVMAMTAARLGRRSDAVDLLLMPAGKNTYRPNGHNAQLPGTELPLYLPGNGGLLLAVAMMAGGWDGSQGKAPGFPDDGSWVVESEGLLPYV